MREKQILREKFWREKNCESEKLCEKKNLEYFKC